MAKHSKVETSYNFTNQDLQQSLNHTIDTIAQSFNKDEEIVRQAVCRFILNTFKQMQLDADTLGYIDFFKKYIHDYRMLSVEDATMSQMRLIIDESAFSTQDKKIAECIFINCMTFEETAVCVGIADSRTIGNNIERIRNTLKLTAYKLFLKS